MKLQEYQAKQLLAAQGVPVPEGEVATSAEAAAAIATKLGGRVVVKAQVLVGGRGKAGGIALAATPAEAAAAAGRLLGGKIKGLPVRQVLVERALAIAQEFYLGLTLDRRAQRMALMASAAGGVDIEETARTQPERIYTQLLDPFLGPQPYQALGAAKALGLPRALWPAFSALVQGLYRAAATHEATLAEINPLVLTQAEELCAADAKMIVDDNALLRHPEMAAWRNAEEETPAERQAREAGLHYIKLEGNIGCLVNGAGLAMATMDLIKLYGGEPANFLDIGGGARAERVAAALGLILAEPQVEAVLVNIFGGITRCDEVARGILGALEQATRRVPLIIRLVGTNEEEGRSLLQGAGLRVAPTLAQAAQWAVASAHEGGMA